MGLELYGCYATGDHSGIIEFVADSETTNNIMNKVGLKGAFVKSPLDDWLRDNNKAEGSYNTAVETFIKSCAGYCVATYIIGIGDRHPSNIMLTRKGNLFHIDFGHILGNFKKKLGVKRERSKFVFTPQMLAVMGNTKDKRYNEFETKCCEAYNIIRENSSLFISLFQLMVSAGLDELVKDDDINYLCDMLLLDANEEDAKSEYKKEIVKSLNTATRQVDNMVHMIKHNK